MEQQPSEENQEVPMKDRVSPEEELEKADFDESYVAELNYAEEIAETCFDERPSRLPQTEYLSSTVLPLIMEGLSWIIKERPKDPVEHLAMFLLKNQNYDIADPAPVSK